jgi:hypothetical protein
VSRTLPRLERRETWGTRFSLGAKAPEYFDGYGTTEVVPSSSADVRIGAALHLGDRRLVDAGFPLYTR